MNQMRSQSDWLHNTACPECRSHGNDKKGDNLAVYRDGHTYCWSCGHRTPPTDRRKADDYMYNADDPLAKCPNFTNRLVVGGENRAWLRKYINDEEIDQFFFYDNVMDRHVFLHNEDEPTWFYSARSVKEVPEKCIQRGTRPALVMGRYKETRVLVIVEDIVSAIKVSRHFGALPLFGSHVTHEIVNRIAKSQHIDRVVVWLDDDKAMQSRVYSRKLSMLLPTISVWTEHDPKDHSDDEIVAEVNTALELLNESENTGVSG